MINPICYMLGHKWRQIHYFSKEDGLFCVKCNKPVLKCKRCDALKCGCQIVELK